MTEKKTKAYRLFCEASARLDRGDIRGALRLYRALAKSGDASGQHSLAYLLADKVKPPRLKEASYWYKRAVRNGYAISAWNLALDYAQRGQSRWQIHWLKVFAKMDKAGAIEDMTDWADTLCARNRAEEALPYLTVAAKLGDARAQNNLAILFETKVQPIRIAEALSWYKKAVRSGSRDAASNLALHYRDNDNPSGQLRWLRVAAKMGHPGAKAQIRRLERALARR
jgi:TPR repeat protein